MEFGHWEILCEKLIEWKSFVYEIIDENDKRYIGVKTKVPGWENYTSSCKPLKSAIANGLKCRYTILKFFASASEGFDYEDQLLVEYDCIKSENYWNRSRSGKEFNTSGLQYGDDQKLKRKGEGNPLFKGWYVINDIKYATLKEAAVALECDPSTVSYRIQTENFPEYIFIDAKTLEPLPKKIAKKKSNIGQGHPKFKGWYIIHGIRYDSLQEASDSLGINRGTIWHRINSDTFPEYTFLPVSVN